jgi:hypothetical protein
MYVSSRPVKSIEHGARLPDVASFNHLRELAGWGAPDPAPLATGLPMRTRS